MKNVLQHFSKKALSAVLALAVVICSMGATFSAFADLGSNDSSVDTIGKVQNFEVTYGSPAVPMVAGYSIDLSALKVQFTKDGEPVSGTEITWEAEAGTSAAEYLNSDTKIFSALSTGIFKLTAKNGENSKTVYIMANEVGDYTYYLENEDLTAPGYSLTDKWYESENIKLGWYDNAAVAGNMEAFKRATVSMNGLALNNPWADDTRMLFYKSDILKDFADYTVSTGVVPASEQIKGSHLGIITRATLADNLVEGSAITAPDSTALFINVRPIGGLRMYGYTANSATTVSNLTRDLSLHTVSDSSLILPGTSDISYVLANGSSNATKFASANSGKTRNLTFKLSGNDILYKLDENIIFDSKKGIKTIEIVVNGENLDNSYASAATDTLSGDQYNSYIDGFNLSTGTVGFAWVRSMYTIKYLRVTLNDISVADDLPVCTKIQMEAVSVSNPVINATAGQEVDLTSYIYEFADGSAHMGNGLDWSIAATNADANENFVTLGNNKKFIASKAGIYALTGTYGTATTTVYIYVGMTDSYTMSDRSPALPMFIKTRMDLGHMAVQFDNGQYYYGRDITWTIAESNENDAGVILNNTAKNIAAIATGTYILKATVETDNGEISRNVYVIANNEGTYDFYIENLDFTAGGYDASKWLQANAAYGNYPKALTVQDNANISGSDGLKLKYGESRMVLYNSDILNEFADYTVSTAFRVESHQFDALNQHFGIITRAQVDFENATVGSTNVFKTPASGASPALSAMLAPYGGVSFQVFDEIFQESHNGGEKIGYYTWENGEDLKPFSVNNESHSDMVLSHKHTTVNGNITTEYIPVSVKVSGADVVYTVRNNVLLDTTKETLNTMKLNLGDRTPVPDSTENGDDKSARSAQVKDKDGNPVRDENGDKVYETVYDDTILAEDTVTSESLKALINTKGTTEAGTVGFVFSRVNEADLGYLKVKLNDVTADNMPAAEPYDPYIVKSNSPALPMTAGTRISLNNFLVQIDSLAYEANTLTYGEVKAVQNGAVENGVKIENGYITAYERGVYSVEVTSAASTKATLYIVVRNADEKDENGNDEYIIYEGDYRSDDADVSDWKTTIVDGSGNVITSGAMHEKVEETTEDYVPDYEYLRTQASNNGTLNYTYYKVVKDVDVNYSGNYNSIPDVKGFVPYNTDEITRGFSAATGSIAAAYTPYYSYTTLDNDVVSALSDYTVTASFKSYTGYRGAIGVIGRISNLEDGKFTSSSTAYGFGSGIKGAYDILSGAVPLKTPFAILGNSFSKITDAATSKYYSDIVGNGYIHRTYSVKYSADTLTVSTPNNDSYTVSGIATNAGGVGFVAYNKDTLTGYTAIPVLADFKVSLKNIDISNLPSEAITHTPAATPEAGEIYTDNGNYKFTVNGGAIVRYEKLDETKDYSEKVVVPSTVNGTTVSGIGVNVFWSNAAKEVRRTIGHAVLSEGIVSTSNNAFRENIFLDTVTFPSTLETIGSESFMDSGVLEVVFHEDDSLTTIGKQAFSAAKSLRKVVLNRSITTIGDNAFSSTVSLYSIELPMYLKSIGNKAFSDSALEDVYIYSRTVSIGENAFPAGTVIHGATGSTAHTYADANGYTFDPIDTEIAAIEAAEAERIRLENEKKEQLAKVEDTKAQWTLKYVSSSKSYLINGFTPSTDAAGKFTLPTVYDYVSGDTVKKDVAVTGVNANAFKNSLYKRQLHSVVIPEGYTTIGESAFEGCINLMYLDLPDTLVTVGKYAFTNNTSLKELTVPERLVKIGDSAFAGDTALTKINIESDSVLNTIGANAFSDTSVETVTLPFNVRYIGANAFSGSKLKEITITNKLCEIGENAFPTGTIINCVKGSLVEEYATKNGYTIDEYIDDVYDETINREDTAAKLTYKANPPYYIVTGYTGNGGKVTIPYEIDYTAEDGTVTKGAVIGQIQYNAFDKSIDKHKIQQVVIPEGVVNIGASSFIGCYNLVKVTIPETVQVIGQYAFSSCDIYGTLSFGLNCQKIESFAFGANKHLTDVYIYNANCTIQDDAFPKTTVIHGYKDSRAERYASKNDLQFVEITETVKWPGVTSYEDNKNYTFTFEEETGTITAYNRKDDSKPYSARVTFPAKINGKTVNTVGSSLFKAKPFTMSIQAAVFEDGITVISDNVFAGAVRLTSVKFPNTLTTIGTSAFSGSGLAGDITIPETVTSIGSSAFANCDNLTSVTITNPTVKIGTGAFSGMGSGFVIRGLKGSTAWEYYERNKSTGIKFVSIGDYVADGEGNAEGEGNIQQGANGEYNENPNNTGAGAITDLTLIIIIALAALILLLLIGAVVIIIVAMSGDDDDDEDDEDDDDEDDDDYEDDEDDE